MKKYLVCAAIAVVFLAVTAHAQTVPPFADVTWIDNSNNEEGFGIERKTGTTGAWGEIARVGVNVQTFQNVNLLYATTYCYRVFAWNTAGGKSAFSNEVCGTSKADPKPAAPGSTTVKMQ